MRSTAARLAPLPAPHANQIFLYARNMIFTVDGAGNMFFYHICWNPSCQTVFTGQLVYETREAAIGALSDFLTETIQNAAASGASRKTMLTKELQDWILLQLRNGANQVIAEECP